MFLIMEQLLALLVANLLLLEDSSYFALQFARPCSYLVSLNSLALATSIGSVFAPKTLFDFATQDPCCLAAIVSTWAWDPIHDADFLCSWSLISSIKEPVFIS